MFVLVALGFHICFFLTLVFCALFFSWPQRSLSPKFFKKWAKGMGDSVQFLHNPVKVNFELKLLVEKYPEPYST